MRSFSLTAAIAFLSLASIARIAAAQHPPPEPQRPAVALQEHPLQPEAPAARHRRGVPDAPGPARRGPRADRAPLADPLVGQRRRSSESDAIIRMIVRRRPELAERLRRLQREAPERFAEVVTDALILRLESALRAPGPEAPPRPSMVEPMEPRRRDAAPERRGPPGAPRPAARHMRAPLVEHMVRDEFAQQRAHLHRRHEELEVTSRELADKLRGLPKDRAEPRVRHELRDVLERKVHEHFEIRTQLRHSELERIEHDLQRLQKTLDELRAALENRQRERDTIIKRRMHQLLGGDGDGW
jgi:hypothetical protein